jgi:TP901 family phage tail tape measure protein
MAQYEISNFVDPKVLADVRSLGEGIQGTTHDLMKFLEAQKALKNQLDQTNNSNSDTTKKMGEYSALVNKAAESHNKLVITAKALDTQQKQLAQTEAKLATSHTATNQKLTEKRLKLQEVNKAMKDKIKTAGAEEGSLVRMRQKLSDLTATYDNTGKRTKEAAKEIQILSKEIEIAENETNRFQRGVGGYREQLGGLVSGVANGTVTFKQFRQGVIQTGKAMLSFLLTPAGLIITAITGLILAGKALIQNAQNFEKAASSLSAITGQVGEDLDFMKAKAIEFSKASLTSAVDILGAFEKVGSAMPALLKNGALLTEVTKNAIVLSEATGGKLSVEDAAAAAAGAMNQFNIPLTDSARAINVLAAGSLEGSADILSLSESFKNVGAVADGAGLSLEQTTALLEVLGEKSIFGSEAGTKLRGSILRLQAAGVGYASGQFNMRDALEEVNQKMSEQGTAMERDAYAQKLFGAENITVGKILLDNVGNYERLTKAVTGTNTAFNQQATQNDNLEGSYARLRNLWKAFMLGFEDGDGLLSRVWRGLIDFSAAFVDGLIQWQQSFERFFSLFESKRKKAEKAAMKEQKDRQAAIEAEAAMIEEQQKIQEEADRVEADRIAALTAKEKEEIENKMKIENEAQKLRDKAEKDKLDKHNNTLKLINERIESERILEKMLADIETAAAKNSVDLIEEKWDDITEEQKAGQDLVNSMIAESILNENLRYQQQVMLIKASAKNDEQYYQLKYDLDKKYTSDYISELTRKLSLGEMNAAQTLEMENEIAKAKMDLEQMIFDDKMEKEEAKKKKNEEIYKASVDLANGLFSFQQKLYDNELQSLEQKNKAGELSDEEYAKKKAEIELKKAKSERMQSLFNIALSTAEAIIKAIAQSPTTFGLPFSGFALAAGGLQAAAVLSEPLPTFAKGTDNAPMRGIFGEAGGELMLTKQGEIYYADKATYFEGNNFKGAKIKTNTETRDILSKTNHSGFGGFSSTAILSGLKSVENAIMNKETIIFDKETRQPVGYQKNGYIEKRINRYQS